MTLPAVKELKFTLAGAKATGVSSHPPIVLLYGPEGRGKTSTALEFPNPFLLQFEEGVPAGFEDVPGTGRINTFEDALEWNRALWIEGPGMGIQTIVIDSLSRMQDLVHDYVVRTKSLSDQKKPAKNIEDFGYGKGYILALEAWEEWNKTLRALNSRKGMALAYIAHSKVKKHEDPLTVSYDRYILDLSERAAEYFLREMDAILFLKEHVSINEDKEGFGQTRTRAGGGRQIFAHTSLNPSFTAKNRYGMPDKVLLEPGNAYGALAEYLPTW